MIEQCYRCKGVIRMKMIILENLIYLRSYDIHQMGNIFNLTLKRIT